MAGRNGGTLEIGLEALSLVGIMAVFKHLQIQ